MKIMPFSMIVDLYKLTKIAFSPRGACKSKIIIPRKGSIVEQKNGIKSVLTQRNLREIKRKVFSHDFKP